MYLEVATTSSVMDEADEIIIHDVVIYPIPPKPEPIIITLDDDEDDVPTENENKSVASVINSRDRNQESTHAKEVKYELIENHLSQNAEITDINHRLLNIAEYPQDYNKIQGSDNAIKERKEAIRNHSSPKKQSRKNCKRPEGSNSASFSKDSQPISPCRGRLSPPGYRNSSQSRDDFLPLHSSHLTTGPDSDSSIFNSNYARNDTSSSCYNSRLNPFSCDMPGVADSSSESQQQNPLHSNLRSSNLVNVSLLDVESNNTESALAQPSNPVAHEDQPVVTSSKPSLSSSEDSMDLAGDKSDHSFPLEDCPMDPSLSSPKDPSLESIDLYSDILRQYSFVNGLVEPSPPSPKDTFLQKMNLSDDNSSPVVVYHSKSFSLFAENNGSLVNKRNSSDLSIAHDLQANTKLPSTVGVINLAGGNSTPLVVNHETNSKNQNRVNELWQPFLSSDKYTNNPSQSSSEQHSASISKYNDTHVSSSVYHIEPFQDSNQASNISSDRSSEFQIRKFPGNKSPLVSSTVDIARNSQSLSLYHKSSSRDHSPSSLDSNKENLSDFSESEAKKNARDGQATSVNSNNSIIDDNKPKGVEAKRSRSPKGHSSKVSSKASLQKSTQKKKNRQHKNRAILAEENCPVSDGGHRKARGGRDDAPASRQKLAESSEKARFERAAPAKRKYPCDDDCSKAKSRKPTSRETPQKDKSEKKSLKADVSDQSTSRLKKPNSKVSSSKPSAVLSTVDKDTHSNDNINAAMPEKKQRKSCFDSVVPDRNSNPFANINSAVNAKKKFITLWESAVQDRNLNPVGNINSAVPATKKRKTRWESAVQDGNSNPVDVGALNDPALPSHLALLIDEHKRLHSKEREASKNLSDLSSDRKALLALLEEQKKLEMEVLKERDDVRRRKNEVENMMKSVMTRKGIKLPLPSSSSALSGNNTVQDVNTKSRHNSNKTVQPQVDATAVLPIPPKSPPPLITIDDTEETIETTSSPADAVEASCSQNVNKSDHEEEIVVLPVPPKPPPLLITIDEAESTEAINSETAVNSNSLRKKRKIKKKTGSKEKAGLSILDVVKYRPHKKVINDLLVYEDYLYTCSDDHTASRFNIRNIADTVIYHHQDNVKELLVETILNEVIVFTCVSGNQISMYGASSGKRIRIFKKYCDLSNMCKGWGNVYSGWRDGSIHIYKWTGNSLSSPTIKKVKTKTSMLSIACTHEGQLPSLIILSKNKIHLRNVEDGTLIYSIKASISFPPCLTIHKNMAYFRNTQNSLTVFDLQNGKLENVNVSSNQSVAGIGVSDKYYFTVSADRKKVICYEMKTKSNITIIRWFGGNDNVTCFSLHKNWVIIAYESGHVQSYKIDPDTTPT